MDHCSRSTDDETQSIVVADALTGKEQFRFTGSGRRFTRVRFSNDGSMLAAASDDQTVTVWDLETGLVLETLHQGDANLYGIGFSADDSLLYTAGPNRALLGWDLEGTSRFIPRESSIALSNDSYAGLLAPTGDRIAYPLVEGGLQVADLDSGENTGTIDTGHREYGSLSWSPDGTRLATTGDDGFVRLWDARKVMSGTRGKALISERRLAMGDHEISDGYHTSHIAAVDYTADGAALIVATGLGKVSMVDAQTLKAMGKTAHLDTDRLVWAFASPERGLAITMLEQTPSAATYPTHRSWALVDTLSGQVVKQGEIELGDPQYADFSPDGKRVAFVGASGDLWLLDLETGKGVRDAAVNIADSGFASVDFSPDGDVIVTTGAAGNVSLWDGQTALPLGTVTPNDHVQLRGVHAGQRNHQDHVLRRLGLHLGHAVRALGGVRLQHCRPQPHDDGMAGRLRRSPVREDLPLSPDMERAEQVRLAGQPGPGAGSSSCRLDDEMATHSARSQG